MEADDEGRAQRVSAPARAGAVGGAEGDGEMTIFAKTVDAIQAADLQELVGVPESAILEYKREVDDWDDIIKELVAFANTFGGHVILGAEGDRSSQLTGLPGMDPVAGFQQKIIDLCFTGAVPPLTPFPSPAIALPGTSKVAYVIHAPASYAGPHFLVNRGGAYVRVGEHSKKYEARLAEWGELIRLADGRQRAIDQLRRLRDRARKRADEMVLLTGAVTMEFFASPSFPAQPIVELAKLREYAVVPQAPAVKAGKISHDLVAAPESIVYGLRPYLYHELTIYGSLYAAESVGGRALNRPEEPETVDLLTVLSNTLLWLEHGRYVFQRIGYEGPLTISLTLRHMKGRVFVLGTPGLVGVGPYAEPRFDEDVTQEMETTTAAMPENLRTDAHSLFLPIAYATDMREVLTSDRAQLIQAAVARLAPHGVTIP